MQAHLALRHGRHVASSCTIRGFKVLKVNEVCDTSCMTRTEAAGTECRTTLKPGGAEALSTDPAAAAGAGGRAGAAAALGRLAGLLDCLERLLTGAFPAAVPLPDAAVLALLRRALAMDTAPVAEGARPRCSGGASGGCVGAGRPAWGGC